MGVLANEDLGSRTFRVITPLAGYQGSLDIYRSVAANATGMHVHIYVRFSVKRTSLIA